MLSLPQRINLLVALGNEIAKQPAVLKGAISRAYLENTWFTTQSIQQALQAICERMLQREALEKWVEAYDLPLENNAPKKVGIVMAGNIPLVGFHDLLSVFITGNIAQIKTSNKDKILPKAIVQLLANIDPRSSKYFSITERLKDFDAIIATGSNNSSRYFEYYFGKYPHIIRKNRTSVAFLTGEEGEEEIVALGKDIFDYFGLGCRNVSKLMVPVGFDVPNFLSHLESYADIRHHNKYINNYDYQCSLLLLNKVPHFASSFLMLVENDSIHSPTGTLYYEQYQNRETAIQQLVAQQEEIQCMVGNPAVFEQFIPFGEAQSPALSDYADQIDTLAFLKQLN